MLDIQFQDPKKLDNGAIVKFNSPDGSKYVVCLSAVVQDVACVSEKVSILTLKPSGKRDAKMFNMIDNTVIQALHENCERWLGVRTKQHVLDERYNRSVYMDKNSEYVLKLKMHKLQDLQVGAVYDLELRCIGVRIAKVSYQLLWELVSVSSSSTSEDANNLLSVEESDEEDDVPEPEPEDLVEIAELLRKELETERNVIQVEYSRWKGLMSSYMEIKQTLEGMSVLTIKQLHHIRTLLDHLHDSASQTTTL